MIKVFQSFVIFCAGVTAPIVAQAESYICEFSESAGFTWDDGSWTVSSFKPTETFPLYASDGSLKDDWDEIAKNSPTYLLECSPPAFAITGMSATGHWVQGWVQICTNYTGETLSFSFDTLTGVLTRPGGGLSPTESTYKDPMVMMPFVCKVD